MNAPSAFIEPVDRRAQKPVPFSCNFCSRPITKCDFAFAKAGAVICEHCLKEAHAFQHRSLWLRRAGLRVRVEDAA